MARQRVTTFFVLLSFGFCSALKLDLARDDVSNELNETDQREIQALKMEVEQLKTTVEHLEEISKLNVASSCEDLKLHSVTTSGNYMIDLDGINRKAPPTEVFCRFDEDGNVFTEIIHDKQDVIVMEECLDNHDKCLDINLTYYANMEQIIRLVRENLQHVINK